MCKLYWLGVINTNLLTYLLIEIRFRVGLNQITPVSREAFCCCTHLPLVDSILLLGNYCSLLTSCIVIQTCCHICGVLPTICISISGSSLTRNRRVSRFVLPNRDCSPDGEWQGVCSAAQLLQVHLYRKGHKYILTFTPRLCRQYATGVKLTLHWLILLIVMKIALHQYCW